MPPSGPLRQHRGSRSAYIFREQWKRYHHMGSVPVKHFLPAVGGGQSSPMNQAAELAVRDCPTCSEPMLALEGEWWCLPCQETNQAAA